MSAVLEDMDISTVGVAAAAAAVDVGVDGGGQLRCRARCRGGCGYLLLRKLLLSR